MHEKMEIQTIQVAYHDENGVWPTIESGIRNQLPLGGVSFLVSQCDQPLPPLNLKFISHKDAT